MTSPAIAPPLEPQNAAKLYLRRIWAIFLRHLYLYMGSWPRAVEMMFWPVINILLWGFTSLYIIKQMASISVVATVMVSGVLLSEIFSRTSMTLLVLFLEEIWSRNLGHMFGSPITISNYTWGIIFTALVRLVVCITPAIIFAKFMFGFSIFSFGWLLAPYLFLLIFNGCWYGLMILAMLFRYGLAAEWLGWMVVWLLSPFIAPYYPVSILPHSLQYVSWCLPATYVFESMKSVLTGGEVHGDYLWISLLLNFFYLGVAAFIYKMAYRSAQKRGGILQVGE